jgi:hypothetical protein
MGMDSMSPSEKGIADAFIQQLPGAVAGDLAGLDVEQKGSLVSIDYRQNNKGAPERAIAHGSGIRIVVDTAAVKAQKPLNQAVGIVHYSVAPRPNAGGDPKANGFFGGPIVDHATSVGGNRDLIERAGSDQGKIIASADTQYGSLGSMDMGYVTAAAKAVTRPAPQSTLKLP